MNETEQNKKIEYPKAKWQKEIGIPTNRSIWDGTLNGIADCVHRNAVVHGFHPESQSEDDWLAHMCCNKHAEISELYDAWRSGKLREPCDKADKMKSLGLPVLSCLEEELADLIIRCLDESRRMKVDIARAVAVKHLYNLTRPFKHGKQS